MVKLGTNLPEYLIGNDQGALAEFLVGVEELGYSYITIWVNDQTAALARLKKLDVAPIAKGPVGLSGGLFLTVVRDPDGNFVELVGPRK